MQSSRWSEVKALLEDAVSLSPSQCEPWLRDIEQKDPELGRELKKLLAFDVKETHEMAFPRGPSEDPDDLTGSLLGVWRLTRELGRGGMGAVWLAERADGVFQMTAAVKLIHHALPSPKLVTRFQRERQILADLRHPHIASLLDGGTTEAGLPYLVMAFVEGLNIDVHCQTVNAGSRQILTLFDQVCEALAFAHDQGILHRDIKPPNIMVAKSGKAMLMDFGIAARPESDETPLTRDFTPMTPEYASPEQLRGASASVASDVYGLGLVLIQLLTQKRPREIASMPQEIDKLRKRQPQIADLLQAMLAPDPEKRPGVSHVRKKVSGILNTPDQTALTPQTPEITEPTRLKAAAAHSTALLPFEPKTLWISEGEFLMGRDGGDAPEWETPQHPVRLHGFSMGEHPVINSQYAAYIKAQPKARAPGKKAGWFLRQPVPNRMDHPVTDVSLFDAMDYCKWLSDITGKKYRLPTEAEWEKAAGGEDGRLYPWGVEWDAALCCCDVSSPTAAHQFPQGKSPYGCQQMVGNVQEWTASWWGDNPDVCARPYPYVLEDRQALTQPTGHSFFIHRGGSHRDGPAKLNCRARGFSNPSGKYPWRGFRVVLET